MLTSLSSLPACRWRRWPLFQRLKHLRVSPWSLPRLQRHMLCCVYLISSQSSLVLAPCCLAPIEASSCRGSGPALRHSHRVHRMDRRWIGLADIPLASALRSLIVEGGAENIASAQEHNISAINGSAT